MTTTIATATATYRIRTIATGRNFGHFAMVRSNRRCIYETLVYATPTAALTAAEDFVARYERWIARQA
jgi:hypothetical protein